MLYECQIKVLNRLSDKQGKEFTLGINASKYKALAKVRKVIAPRELSDLLQKNCLTKLPDCGRSARYALTFTFYTSGTSTDAASFHSEHRQLSLQFLSHHSYRRLTQVASPSPGLSKDRSPKRAPKHRVSLSRGSVLSVQQPQTPSFVALRVT